MEALSLWLVVLNSYRSSKTQVNFDVKGFEHETTVMGRVTEGVSLNIVLIQCSLLYIRNLIRSSDYV